MLRDTGNNDTKNVISFRDDGSYNWRGKIPL